MSRGLGATQRSILDALTAAGEPLSVYELAEHVYGRRALHEPPRAQRETIRRALLTLKRDDLVDLGYGTAAITGDADYTTRRHLVAWLPGTDNS